MYLPKLFLIADTTIQGFTGIRIVCLYAKKQTLAIEPSTESILFFKELLNAQFQPFPRKYHERGGTVSD
jgi:hypothetical protein